MEHPPTRNDAIERLLREAHGPFAVAAAGPCVAPEEMAAWVEGALSDADAARVEAHAASCPDCQALVAALARTVPAHGRAWMSMRWAAPVAAAAVLVLGVWLTRPGQDVPTAVSPETQVARLEDAPTTLPAEPTVPTREGNTEGRPELNRQAPPSPRSANDVSAPRVAVAPPAAPPSPAAPSPAPVAEAAPRSEQPAEQARNEERSKTLASAEPTRQAEADQRAPVAGVGGLAAQVPSAAAFRQRADAQAIGVASPSGRTRCRTGARGAVEISNDGGQSFVAVTGSTPATAAALVGGVSPSEGVCWLVGRAGLVMLVRDGRASMVRVPDAGDLTSVQVDGEAAAVVRGADGRAWRTQDGGQRWSAVASGR